VDLGAPLFPVWISQQSFCPQTRFENATAIYILLLSLSSRSISVSSAHSSKRVHHLTLIFVTLMFTTYYILIVYLDKTSSSTMDAWRLLISNLLGLSWVPRLSRFCFPYLDQPPRASQLTFIGIMASIKVVGLRLRAYNRTGNAVPSFAIFCSLSPIRIKMHDLLRYSLLGVMANLRAISVL
jgi:hypothetical protein